MADHPAIKAEGLRKHYGDKHALDGFDLHVPPGTVCGLLGPNGAGKTTAVRILTTLLRADGGHAEVAGIDVMAHPDEVAPTIGLSGQEPAVDEILTARQNLVLFGRLNGLATRAAARPGRGAARPVRSGRYRHEVGQAVLGRHAAPPRSRRHVDPGPGRAVPGRADDRARSAQPQRGVDRDQVAGRRGHDRAADDAVPRGGRPPRRPGGRHGLGPGDRDRHARRTEAASRRRPARDRDRAVRRPAGRAAEVLGRVAGIARTSMPSVGSSAPPCP